MPRLRRFHLSKPWRRGLLIGAVTLGVLLCAVFGINAHVCAVGGAHLTDEETAAAGDYDCVIVFGAGVLDDGTLTHILADRMDTAIALYKNGAADKLLLSGDHGQTDYNEVGSMRDYALQQGVPSEDIFLDHAGFSTYETLYRAKEIFGVKSAVLVTQTYHLYRALYIGEKLSLTVSGVGSDPREYRGKLFREAREIAARNKDFFSCLFWPKPTYLGDAIPISGDGQVTWDDKTEI